MDSFLDIIKSRRSVRHFTDWTLADEVIDSILEAGRWAPSGMNNQPWSFAVIKKPETKQALASLTHYGQILLSAPVLIAVFLDNAVTYDRTKDCQAVGACIQNMLLYIHSKGLGAVWLGEILRSKDKVAEVLHDAERTQRPVKELLVERGLLTREEVDALLGEAALLKLTEPVR